MTALLVLVLAIITAGAWAAPPRPRGYQPRDTGKAKGAPPPSPAPGRNSGRRV